MAPLVPTTVGLKGLLNQTQLQFTNQPEYQFLTGLIDYLDKLNNAAGVISTSSGKSGKDGKDGIPGIGIDGIDGIGIPGVNGTNGTNGIDGIIGISIPGLDGLDGSDGLSITIPGPAGAQGIQGIPGSASWTLISSSSPSGVNNVAFTGLAGYGEIRVLVRLMTFASNDETVCQVSIDNGATYLTSSGDYIGVSGLGGESNKSNLEFYAATNTTPGRSGEILIEGFNLTDPKVVRSNFFSTDSVNLRIIPTANALSALKVLSASANNFTGGTIYVFGR